MSIWNDLSSKAAKAAEDLSDAASKKAEDTRQISNLNAAIRKEENNINEMYMNIGKAYVEMYRDDSDNDFPEWTESIADSEEKILDCKRRISYIKNGSSS